jgi:PAS domain S-box-containing protein
MADSATATKLTRSRASFALRYGSAFASVAGALLLDLLFRHFNLPHPFAAFALSAIAITFLYGGTKPGIVAVLLSSLIRGFIFEGETSTFSRVLYDLVFLTFAILMIWVRRGREALEVRIADRTAKLTALNEDLQREKEQLDGLFELSPDAVILADDDFHVLRVNKEFTRVFGYTAEEAAGQWLPELIVPEELRAEAQTYRDRLTSGNRVELETIRQHKDGVRFDVSVVARGISLGFDQVGFYLIYRDITERKKAERDLGRSEAYLAEAQKLTHTGSWAWNVRTGVRFWSREIFRIYDCEYQETGPTWLQFLERVHPEDRSQIEQRAKMEASGEWMDSQIDFRIVLPDGTVKHLHSVAHPVRDDSGEVAEVVGTVIDVTEQWKARTELEEAFEEIKQRTEAARRGESELRDVVNTVPAYVWRTSPEGHVDFVNDRWLQFTGLTLEGAFGWKWEAVLQPDDRTRVVDDWHTALKNGQVMESEARVRRADGEYCWWFIRNVPLRDETGKVVRWYGAAIDIEDRKRAEQALQKSEERWRSVFENSAIGVALTDLNGRFLATNHVYQTMVGYTEEELHTVNFLDVTHQDYREANWALVTELLEGKRRQFQIEKKYLRKDGSSVWVSNNVSLVPGTDRVPRFIMALSEDITQRKRAEEALQRSEAYLAEAQKLTHTGSWVWNVRTDALFWSQEVFRIYDYDPKKMAHPTWDFFERIHPDDRPKFEQRKKGLASAQKEWPDSKIDFRIVLPDGTIKHLQSIAHQVIESGDEIVGTVMDVTERKRTEEKLQRSEADLLEAQRISQTGSWKLDVSSGQVIVSPQIFRIFGVKPDEGMSTPEFWLNRNHPEDAKRIQELFERSTIQKTNYDADYRIVLPDGSIKHLHAVGHPVLNESGDLVEFVGTAIDVTEQAQARIELEKAFEQIKRLKDRLHDENLALREQIDQAFMFEDIVGSSPALQTVLSSIVKVAPTDSTVLITGETGTGKELIARAIHKHSQRSGQAFISVNCASIPSSLIASELFGHEKGAFTGAVERRQGRFELAHSGTIFLDEVGDVPAETQIALLRVLQERQFERVGGNRILTTDVRVIAATNRDLTAAIDAGTFRSDLFYRLNVFPIEVPPLRKRKEDIPMLVEYFVKRYAEKGGKQIRKIDKNTLELCQSYPWPGNIRELQNIVERSVILTSGDTFWIEKAWLANQEPAQQELPGPLPDTLQNQEKEMIETALAECKGKVAGPGGAAAKLGIPRSTLDSKIKQLNIKKHKFFPQQ